MDLAMVKMLEAETVEREAKRELRMMLKKPAKETVEREAKPELRMMLKKPAKEAVERDAKPELRIMSGQPGLFASDGEDEKVSEGPIAEGWRFHILPREVQQKILRIEAVSFRKCSRRQWTFGCSSCDPAKALRYWVHKAGYIELTWWRREGAAKA